MIIIDAESAHDEHADAWVEALVMSCLRTNVKEGHPRDSG